MKKAKLFNRRTISYEEYGDPKGKVFFYFHGWPASRLSGETLDRDARKLGIRIISPDRPGYGFSTDYNNRGLLDYPDDILKLKKSLAIGKFSVLGASGGAPYAIACAYKIPDHLELAVISSGLGPLKIMSADTNTPFIYRIFIKTYRLWRWTTYLWLYLSRYLSNNFPTLYMQIISFNKPDYDKKILRDPFVANKFIQKTKESFRQGINGPWKDFNIYMSDWGFSLRDVKKKVTIYHAQGDKNAPVWMGRFYQTMLPNNKYFEVSKDKGHFLLQNFSPQILQAKPISSQRRG